MMEYKKYLLILYALFLCSTSFSQRLWDVKILEDDFYAVQQDTSIDHLRDFIAHRHPKIYAAARILAVSHGVAERDFILGNLSNWFDDNVNSALWWVQYYQYQLFRGYYGDVGAKLGMDTVAKAPIINSLRVSAIKRLAESGELTYFDTLRNIPREDWEVPSVPSVLAIYGQNSNYKIPAGDLLVDSIMYSNDYQKVSWYGETLGEFDKPRVINLLETRFHSLVGNLKWWVYRTLEKIEPDKAPELTMEAMQNEPDEIERGDYIPDYSYIVKTGKPTTKFLTPWFVKFLKEWLTTEQLNIVRYEVRREFLNPFVPLQPSSNTPLLALVDSLVSTKETVAAYNWVGDQNFVDGLDSNLTNSRNFLLQGDSNNCARQIKLFQQKVDEEYKDSLDDDTKTINLEGWKFLYYNAQYILARLPVPPTPLNHYR